MPRPRTATSWEVMPPLATTQAGSAATAAWTTSMTAVDTLTGDLQAGGGVGVPHEGPAGEQEDVGLGERAHHPGGGGGDVGVAAAGAATAGT